MLQERAKIKIRKERTSGTCRKSKTERGKDINPTSKRAKQKYLNILEQKKVKTSYSLSITEKSPVYHSGLNIVFEWTTRWMHRVMLFYCYQINIKVALGMGCNTGKNVNRVMWTWLLSPHKHASDAEYTWWALLMGTTLWIDSERQTDRHTHLIPGSFCLFFCFRL